MVFSWKKITYFMGIAVMAIGFGTVAYAQTIPDDLAGGGGNFGFDVGPTADDVEVSVNPENPGAFTQVTLTLSSDYVDLNRYQINWSVDGKIIQTGIGKRSATVTTKDYGERSVVIISVALAEGTVTKQIVLAPEDMTLLWEAADSYVPPFYQGKKLAAREALLKIVSIPNFSVTGTETTNAKSNVYNWRRNDFPVADAGGYARDSFTFRHNKIRATEKIETRATDVGNNHQAIKSITVPFNNPKILFYEQNAATGLKSLFAKSSIYFTGESATITAEPYFFSTTNNNPNTLRFDWTMNGQSIALANPKYPQKLQLQNPGTTGVAQIGLSIESLAQTFQAARSNLSAVFNGNK